jgi:hypothetical protein
MTVLLCHLLCAQSAGLVDPTNAAWDSSRKPLVAHFVLKSNGASYFVVNNHFTSKGGSQQLGGPIQPPANGGEDKRVQQAKLVRDFVVSLLCRNFDANVVVLGDFNEFDGFPALQVRSSQVDSLLLGWCLVCWVFSTMMRWIWRRCMQPVFLFQNTGHICICCS